MNKVVIKAKKGTFLWEKCPVYNQRKTSKVSYHFTMEHKIKNFSKGTKWSCTSPWHIYGAPNQVRGSIHQAAKFSSG